jgi:hypothetical protein
MEKSYIEILKKALEARMKEGSFPPKLEVAEGEEVLVRIVDILPSPWRPDTKIYIVYNLYDDLQYRLPINTAIYRILQDTGAKVGDYLLLKYLGTTTTKTGKTVKRWSVGYLSSEEASKILGEREKSETIIVERTANHQVEKEKKHEESEAREKPKLSEEDIKKFIDSLIDIYGFATLKDLDYYLNKVKNLGVKVDEEYVKKLGFKVQGDKVVK